MAILLNLVKSITLMMLPLCLSQCMANVQSVLPLILVSQVVLVQTAHYWANSGVLLDGRMRLGVALETINLSG